MTPETFLDGRVTLLVGDCLDVLAALPENSVDSVVCDPPYHLTSIVKRFGGDMPPRTEAAKGKHAYGRHAAGFMGKAWDGGGSAARFFYAAKADAEDRIGSRHPTVKPLDLIQYLCRLITPKGGTVLDLFAGTGTTGEAAWREGFNAILIEREAEYADDIRRRMKLALAGPDERRRVLASVEAGRSDAAPDHGPLFGECA